LVIGGPGRLFTPLVAVLVLEILLSRLHWLGDARTLFHGLLLAAALLARPLASRLDLAGRFRRLRRQA